MMHAVDADFFALGGDSLSVLRLLDGSPTTWASTSASPRRSGIRPRLG